MLSPSATAADVPVVNNRRERERESVFHAIRTLVQYLIILRDLPEHNLLNDRQSILCSALDSVSSSSSSSRASFIVIGNYAIRQTHSHELHF